MQTYLFFISFLCWYCKKCNLVALYLLSFVLYSMESQNCPVWQFNYMQRYEAGFHYVEWKCNVLILSQLSILKIGLFWIWHLPGMWSLNTDICTNSSFYESNFLFVKNMYLNLVSFVLWPQDTFVGSIISNKAVIALLRRLSTSIFIADVEQFFCNTQNRYGQLANTHGLSNDYSSRC